MLPLKGIRLFMFSNLLITLACKCIPAPLPDSICFLQ